LKFLKKGGENMKQITPYLFFEGNCKEAMTFYNEIFGGDLVITKIGDSPEKDAAHMPANKDLVMHAAISVDGNMVLMASDTMMPEQTAEKGEGAYSAILCTSKEEIENIYNKLSEGGKINQPLVEAFFGWFGTLTDKYGVKWMLEFDHPKKD
jgi:PhnB protein